ncbi:Zinc finger RING-type [Arabidopsis thaliana x Arabidopsis arenosa]|uniref:Zinc finger RING-type n=1 Tax=Arabidopsis thaliana x Arabidopsis arenosa TaxID=1240361 RepID=A0A8T2AQ06_9BRAS|nr:Zinc finger RING-type [Arabidopsis thaliana x Arabidopsis arenosa]
MAAKEIAGGSGSIDDGSNFDPCPICLGPFLHDSYLDTCFHKFCFSCIKQWIKVVSSKASKQLSSVKCPLCKTENFSIIHNYDGCSFDRHYINRNIPDGFVLTKEQRYRLQCYYTESGFLADVFDVARFWKLQKFLQPNRCLEAWLRRELQALMQEEDVDIVMHHLVGVMDSFCKRIKQRRKQEARSAETTNQEQFKAAVSEAARPFVMARTDRFVDELELFLAAGLNLEAYDAIYKQRLGWNNRREMGAASEEREEVVEHNLRTRVTPYLFIFEEDSD